MRSVTDLFFRQFFFNTHVRERLFRKDFFFHAFRALCFNRIAGDYAEFGTGEGMTFGLAYQEARRHGHGAKFWAFDSFQGLPTPQDSDEHPSWIPGKMAMNLEQFHAVCRKNGIPLERYSVVPGFYEETLATMAPEAEPTNIALAYVDCDLYSSTRAVLDFLEPRLKHGMIVAFDDYFCWSSTQAAGERKAMLELSARNATWEWVPYVQFGWHGQSFVIEDRALTATNAVVRRARA